MQGAGRSVSALRREKREMMMKRTPQGAASCRECPPKVLLTGDEPLPLSLGFCPAI